MKIVTTPQKEIKKEIPKPETKQEQPKQTTSASKPATTSAPKTDLTGNGNGSPKVSTSSNFNYENSSIFDDNKNLNGKEAMRTIQGSSFYKGRNDSEHTARMSKQLNEIQTECKRWNVEMDADGDGVKTTTSLAKTIADSYDSVLDLYITEQVEKMMDKYGTGTKHGGYLSDAALEELAMKGIRADSVGNNSNRIYAFSLIDVKDDIREIIEKEVKTDAEKKKIWDAVYANDAVVMKDSNGKKGSCVFADCLIPDGSAQKCEINLASILDQMGYDCISKSDFAGKENEYMELISKVENNINNGAYHELNKGQQASTITDTYGKVGSVRQALNTLWKHDTSGKGGGKFAHGLGDGSDAYVSSSSGGEGVSGFYGDRDKNEEITASKDDLNTSKTQKEQEAEKKAEKLKEEKEVKKQEEQQKTLTGKIERYIENQFKDIKEEYLENSSYLSKSEKIDITKELLGLVNEKFDTDMTYKEIYDTIF